MAGNCWKFETPWQSNADGGLSIVLLNEFSLFYQGSNGGDWRGILFYVGTVMMWKFKIKIIYCGTREKKYLYVLLKLFECEFSEYFECEYYTDQ